MSMFGFQGSDLMRFGAGILSGDDLQSGLGRGVQMMLPAMEERQKASQWQSQLAQQKDLAPQMRQALSMMGPDQGAKAYAQHLFTQAQPAKSDRPWWAGPNGSIDPAMARYREMGRPATNVTVNGDRRESEFDKVLGGEQAKQYMESQKSLPGSVRKLGDLRQLEQSLADPNLYTGTLGNQVQGLKQAAQTLFGVPMDGVASGEVAQKLSKEIALGFKDNLPGPLSNSDREFLVSMAPGLTNTPEGNGRVIQMGITQRRYEIDRARAYQANVQRNGGRPGGDLNDQLAQIDDQYSQKFATIMGELRRQAQAPPRSPLVGVPDLRQLYKGLE